MAKKIRIADNFHQMGIQISLIRTWWTRQKKKVTAVYIWIGPINIGMRSCLFREILFLILPMPVDLMPADLLFISISWIINCVSRPTEIKVAGEKDFS